MSYAPLALADLLSNHRQQGVDVGKVGIEALGALQVFYSARIIASVVGTQTTTTPGHHMPRVDLDRCVIGANCFGTPSEENNHRSLRAVLGCRADSLGA